MQLKSVRVQNFKSVDDSSAFAVDQLTCLVGKNEAGKTALLHALRKLNPVEEGEAKYDYRDEYPRKSVSEYEAALKRQNPPRHAAVLTTTWDLGDEEADAVAASYGPDALRSRTVMISKGYSNVRNWNIDLDEAAIVRHLLGEADLSKAEHTSLQKHGTLGDLIEAVESKDPRSERLTKLLADLKKLVPKAELVPAVANLLRGFLPQFVYFSNYDKLPGRVSIQLLQQHEQQENLTREEEVFLALLKQVDTTPAEMLEIDRREQFFAKLEGFSNRISEQIFEYWSQNTNLEVLFAIEKGLSGDPAPFNSGDVFWTRIRNTRHRVTVPFDERSTGFVWFFSFLVWFSQVKDTYGDRLILLLDEPGLSLHGKAQADLLRFFKEKLLPDHQVIYTTHSPFMVDPENLLSTRLVEDVVPERGHRGAPEGTRVSEEVLTTDPDTLFPLQAALGYDITQSLFVGKHSLLVEGPSDLLYLKWFSHELSQRKRTALDARWTITPVGGIEKVSSFAALFGGNKLHVAALVDYAEGGKGKVRHLREAKVLQEGHVLTAETYAGQGEADTEDILGRPLYIDLVNQAYGLTDKYRLPDAKPASAPERVVKEVEEHFRTFPPNAPGFDHFGPADYLVSNGGTLRKTLPGLDDALAKFEQLFKDVNALLPS